MRAFPCPNRRLPAFRPTGFTLVEVLVAITVVTLASTALFLEVTTALTTTNNTLYDTIAMGMAEQLMDEIVGNPYMQLNTSPYQATLGPESGESIKGTRQGFNDIDDFNGYSSKPPVDAWGVQLGLDDGQGGQRNPAFRAPTAMFANWQRQVSVYYVSDTNWTQALVGQTSDYRAVEVQVVNVDAVRGNTVLAKVRRIVSYVPPAN